MTNKQYTFSLPPEVGMVIDALPKMKKSEYVADALMLKGNFNAKKRLLTMLDNIKPRKWLSNKGSVELVQEAREIRAQQLINN